MAGSEFDAIPVPMSQSEATLEAAPVVVEESAAVVRFNSCRWRQVLEDGIPAHCTHREVAPLTGTAGFKPDAWCPDCTHYKVRRTPRKRPPQAPEDRYYY